MEPEGFSFAFDITSDSFVLNVNLPLNPHLIATPIVKLHHSRNLHPFHLVVTYEIAVLNHAEVMQFSHERVKKWLVKVKNLVNDGRELKVFVSPKREE